ncbi:MAG TPA: DUF5667 domain-containing protein [Candidatus Paceibacterota bacterium]|nr:DUF5667 domain-containing protein [Candidatus Paceibacterota bacterium]
MKLNFFNNDRMPRAAKKAMAPGAKFLKSSKGRFLAAFDAAHGTHTAPRFAFAWGYRIGVAFVALVAVAASAFAYADTANVGADSPLYPLKRLSESVQIALAAQNSKAELQAQFAARRTQEIDALQAAKPSSKTLPKLRTDLNTELNASIDDSEDSGLNDGKLSSFCANMFATVTATSSAAVRGELSLNPGILARFDAQCGDEPAPAHGQAVSVTSSAGISATTTIRSTVRNLLDTLGIPGIMRQEERDGNGTDTTRGTGDRGQDGADTTSTVPSGLPAGAELRIQGRLHHGASDDVSAESSDSKNSVFNASIMSKTGGAVLAPVTE